MCIRDRIKTALSLFILLQFTFFISNGQSVTGKVSDTAAKKDIGNAVVALLTKGDSILYKFVRSGKDGDFTISNTKPGEYILLITHPFFADFIDDITVPAAGI